jgi:hypothetical protein
MKHVHLTGPIAEQRGRSLLTPQLVSFDEGGAKAVSTHQEPVRVGKENVLRDYIANRNCNGHCRIDFTTVEIL